MNQPEGQIACWNVYPEPGKSRLHFNVRVFSSIGALRRYLKTGPIRRSLGRYGVAMCSGWTEEYKRSKRVTPCMGEILIPRSRLRAGVIAHECTHAALWWAKRLRFTPVQATVVKRGHRGHRFAGENEERFCYGLGEMVRQVAVQVWDRGLGE